MKDFLANELPELQAKLTQLEIGFNAMLDDDTTTPMGLTLTERPDNLNLNSEDSSDSGGDNSSQKSDKELETIQAKLEEKKRDTDTALQAMLNAMITVEQTSPSPLNQLENEADFSQVYR